MFRSSILNYQKSITNLFEKFKGSKTSCDVKNSVKDASYMFDDFLVNHNFHYGPFRNSISKTEKVASTHNKFPDGFLLNPPIEFGFRVLQTREFQKEETDLDGAKHHRLY